jgi:hypothetical protein
MRKRITQIAIFILMPLMAYAGDNIPGKYQAVSESEWSLTLELNTNGAANIETSNWLAGKHNERTIETYTGKWKSEGNTVYITYNGITEILKYSETLSLSELGESGGIPGLKGQAKAWDKGVIGSISLWSSDALKGRYK